MLEIFYTADGEKKSMQFKDPAAFVANLQLEVPALQDHYRVDNVLINGQKDIDFKGKTVVDLFNFYL
ncbi:hypothetical protein LB941_06625 [Ligilactobacillus sp. WILCCON 0076]|uniref:Uncharacterized protein n=1 Tax=Ligilactobacillus ubinensis TaxID=2876789 RepID=A0A9X2JLI5_9LACO|nr:hypothetical protein [Ligilactobacillus ubinensis]MCP0887008.1 hypothetical protein [Ligilactobacillus ubinensis]